MSLFQVPISVSKSVIIDKPLAEVFVFVRDYKNDPNWSPWFVMEPGVNIDLSDNTSEEGSSYFWDSEYIGSGQSTQIKIIPDKAIYRDLQFLKPWKSTAKIRFDFEVVDEGTKVVWNMDSSLPFFMFWMKNKMEAWVGADFVRGLSMLKEYLETGRVESKTSINGIEDRQGFEYIGIKSRCALDQVGYAMEADFKALDKVVRDKKIEVINPTFSVYHDYDPINNRCVYTSGIAIKEKHFDLPENIILGEIKGGKALNVTHKGSYFNLGNGWSTAYSYLKAKKMKPNTKVDPLEVYVNDPATTKPADLITEIYIPVR